MPVFTEYSLSDGTIFRAAVSNNPNAAGIRGMREGVPRRKNRTGEQGRITMNYSFASEK
jgi:hypothetical protein